MKGIYIMASCIITLSAWADKGALSADEKLSKEWAKQDTVAKLDLVLETIPTNNLGGATHEIAEIQKMITQTKLDLVEARSFENSMTKIKVGYVSFAPYIIYKDPLGSGKYVLEDGDSTGSAFIEVSFANHYAWRSKTNVNLGFAPWRGLDKEAKLGFILNNSMGDNEISGSTIAAGGDIYAEFSVGYPLYYAKQENGLQSSFNFPEGVATFVTDKSNFDIHDSYKLGGAFVASGADTPDKRSWKLLARLGIGWVETPVLSGNQTTNGVPIIETNKSSGLPEFEADFGTFAQVLFDLPIQEHGTISLSGEFWSGYDINPWSAYISYSVSYTGLKSWLPF